MLTALSTDTGFTELAYQCRLNRDGSRCRRNFSGPACGKHAGKFIAVFDDIDRKQDITYAHAANAIAAFEAVARRADNSAYDQYLAGDNNAMSAHAIEGMELFNFGSSQGGVPVLTATAASSRRIMAITILRCRKSVRVAVTALAMKAGTRTSVLSR